LPAVNPRKIRTLKNEGCGTQVKKRAAPGKLLIETPTFVCGIRTLAHEAEAGDLHVVSEEVEQSLET
jgi:hypothetical protein